MFFGLSENAVKTQIWIAVCVYVLIAIVKKKVETRNEPLHNFQVISMTTFEKMPIFEAFHDIKEHTLTNDDVIQLN